MQKLLYEYAVVRVVPRVEREEFINAGIILFCKEKKYLKCKTFLYQEKLQCLDEKSDIEMVMKNLQAFEAIASGRDCESNIAKLDLPSRFRWLTATRSTVIQCSKVHPGFSVALEDTFEKLYAQFVL